MENFSKGMNIRGAVVLKIRDKVSASQPWGRGFDSHTGHEHDSSYDTRKIISLK